MTAEPAPSRIPSLTGMRFVAAALVFFFHLPKRALQDFSQVFGNAGFVGVSFFFILSGFVLTWSARPDDTVRKFWRRRLFKIFPNHVLTFAVAVVLLAATGQAAGLPQTLANLFLLQAWLPDYSFMNSANGVSWSLSAEMLFYLSFPLLLGLVKKIRPGRLWWWAGGVTTAILLLPLVSLAFLPGAPQWPWGPASFAQIWFVYGFPPARMLEFALGMLLARIVLAGRWIRIGYVPAVLLAVAGYAASLLATPHFLYRFAAMTVIPIAVLIPAAARADVEGKRTLTNSRAMVWLGEISFAFYLVHHLVMLYGYRMFGLDVTVMNEVTGPKWSTAAEAAFVAACFAATVFLAWALYVLVERPAMRRWSRPPGDLSGRPEPDAVPTGR